MQVEKKIFKPDGHSLNLLRKVLSIPSKSHHEGQLATFIKKWLATKKIKFKVDSIGNIYAIKSVGEKSTRHFFPCVVSHMDTVHRIERFQIAQEMRMNAQGARKPSLKGYDFQDYPAGIGGDDKCGVFACLMMLTQMRQLKAVFFVQEEVGRLGSAKANRTFFKDVGYVIGLDSPENNIVSKACRGLRLFDKNSKFHKKCHSVLKSFLGRKLVYSTTGATDVYEIRRKFHLQCINLPVGYYQNHTRNEYVVIEDTYTGVAICQMLIEKLGIEKY